MISGVLIDKYGIPRMVIVLISAACFGQLLFTGGTLFRVNIAFNPVLFVSMSRTHCSTRRVFDVAVVGYDVGGSCGLRRWL